MEINLKEMKNRKKLYENMWVDSSRIIPGDICKTYSKRKKDESDDSYSFVVPNFSSEFLVTTKLSNDDRDIVAKQLIDIFGIKEKDIFLDKFKEVCSGSGGEGSKITTLHSSSLCAFLFFFKVSTKNPLKLPINGGEVEFDEVHFEYQNTVIKGASNVDIVLIGKDEEGKDIILFLESKFSEYLSGGQANISLKYKEKFPEIYNPKFLDDIGFEFKNNKEENICKIGPKQGSVYSEGIKQMISHYIGIENYLKTPKKRCDSRILPKDATVYLGEIMFDFSFKRAGECFDNYSKAYKNMAKELNSLINNNEKFKVLEEVLQYSDPKLKLKLFVNATIKEFYFGK